MFKKNLVILLSILITFLPTQVIAAQSLDGTVTSLNVGESAPYAGILLDPIAASKMLVDQKYLKLELELKLRKEFQEEFASKKFAFDLLEFYFTSKIVRSRLSKTTRNFLKIYKPTKVNKLIGLVKRFKLKYREI